MLLRWIFGPVCMAALTVAAACSSPDREAPPAGTAAPEAAVPAGPLTFTELASPAAPGSLGADLAAAPDGRVYLSWLEPLGADGHALRFAASTKTGWSEPRTIATGRNWFATNVRAPFMTVLPDGTLVAAWVGDRPPGTEAGNIYVVRSRDQGASWSTPLVPHTDRTVTQHAFLSLAPMADGRLHAVWLDGRHAPAGPHAHGGGEMALMHTTIGPDGSVGAEMTLDARVCDCCPTSAVALSDGSVLAVYRDRSPDEIRDISVVRYADGRWSDPAPLTRDNWKIAGCPVNGPSVSADGRHAAVAWFTMDDDEGRVQLVRSADAGATFGAPVRIDDGKPAGRADVLSLPDGRAVVSWVERMDDGLDARVRVVTADGERGPAVSISGPAHIASGAVPRLVRTGSDVMVTWTDAANPSRIRTARAPTSR